MRREERIRKYLVNHVLFGIDSGVDYDTSFWKNGNIDSVGVLHLAEFIGEHFSIVVEDEEIVPENLDSINRIVSFIERKRAQVSIGLSI